MPGEDRDERALVAACLAGDQSACTALVASYARMVGTVIWRATGQRDIIEDLTQETFLRIFKALEYFDSRARLSTWIYTIAHNVAVDHLRRAAGVGVDTLTWREGEADTWDTRELVSEAPGPEALLSRAEAEALVTAGLTRVPLKYRLPVIYAAIDGLDYPNDRPDACGASGDGQDADLSRKADVEGRDRAHIEGTPWRLTTGATGSTR